MHEQALITQKANFDQILQQINSSIDQSKNSTQVSLNALKQQVNDIEGGMHTLSDRVTVINEAAKYYETRS